VKNDSLFRPLETTASLVEFEFEDHKIQAPDGSNLAAALLAAGIVAFRYTPVSGAPRAAFCMMGACFDCLVDIEGVHRQACMCQVRPGLVVRQIKPELADE
jgi:predicted molibdopterin-dependent oxidoreductase YjgC